MKRYYYLLLCALAPIIFLCGQRAPVRVVPVPDAAVYDTLVILSTNDVHAHIDPMAKEAAYIQSVKRSYSRVLVVSAGDIFSGNPVVDRYAENGQPRRGYPIVELMNRAGYDAMGLGNHDFDYGQAVLKERIEQANFPFLCANADFSHTTLAGLIPAYYTMDVRGIKVTLLALLQIGTGNIPSSHPKNVAEIDFTYSLTENYVTRYAPLRDSCDVLLVLSHLGIEDDRKLAPMFPEADVVIGGHSHTKISPPEIIGGVMITQTGANLSYIGQTTLILKDKKIVSRQNELIDVAQLTDARPDMESRIQEYNNHSPMNRVIGQATDSLTGKNALGCLMTDALTEQLNLDMAFANNGGIRVDTIAAGDITMSQIYKLDPFENEVIVYHMTLFEIQALLRYACRYNQIDFQISGAKYTYHTATQTVALTDYNNVPLSPAKTYKVGMNSYIASMVIPFVTPPPATSGENLSVTTAATLVDYIIARRHVSPQAQRAFVAE
jgi:2',3'-cyclic-nucleotide 2'-phosphodiesterase (5'-nucleotidase family)